MTISDIIHVALAASVLLTVIYCTVAAHAYVAQNPDKPLDRTPGDW